MSLSLSQWLVLLALAPAGAWVMAALLIVARRALRRRGDEDQRCQRLEGLLSGAEVIVIPTGDIDLSEQRVREIADARGYRLLGYERGRGPLRRRSGVFFRREGAIATMASTP